MKLTFEELLIIRNGVEYIIERRQKIVKTFKSKELKDEYKQEIKNNKKLLKKISKEITKAWYV